MGTLLDASFISAGFCLSWHGGMSLIMSVGVGIAYKWHFTFSHITVCPQPYIHWDNINLFSVKGGCCGGEDLIFY